MNVLAFTKKQSSQKSLRCCIFTRHVQTVLFNCVITCPARALVLLKSMFRHQKIHNKNVIKKKNVRKAGQNSCDCLTIHKSLENEVFSGSCLEISSLYQYIFLSMDIAIVMMECPRLPSNEE